MTKKINDVQELMRVIVQEIEDTKGFDIVILDLKGKVTYTDYFILATGNSDRQVQAMADRIELKLKKDYQRRPFSIEGHDEAQWVLVDYGDVVVHLFLPETREYYDLESMWKGIPQISAKKILETVP